MCASRLPHFLISTLGLEEPIHRGRVCDTVEGVCQPLVVCVCRGVCVHYMGGVFFRVGVSVKVTELQNMCSSTLHRCVALVI